MQQVVGQFDTIHMEEVCDTSDRAAWLAHRLSGIGASEAAMLLGLSPWGSALSLYAEKVGITEREALDNERVEWGNRLEPVIMQGFGEKTGRPVIPCGRLFRSRAWPWALATFDAFCQLEDGRIVPLQIKTTGAEHADDWLEGPPPGYAVQCQQEMLVAGTETGTIACLIGGQRLVWQDLIRDAELTTRIIAAGSLFWQCVERREPPAADDSTWSKRALGWLYPRDTGELLQLPATLLEAADTIEQAKLDIAVAEAAIRHAEALIKEEMKTASEGALPDGRRFTWRLQERAGYTVAPTTARVFRSHKAKGGH